MSFLKLNEIIKKINQLQEFQPISHEAESAFWKKFRLEYNYHSNRIEGNTLSYGETVNLLERGIASEKSFRDNLEIKAHDLALEEIKERVENIKAENFSENPLSHKFIREINKTILKEPFYKECLGFNREKTKREIIPGDYKKLANSVMTQDGEIFAYAAPEEVHALISDLLDEMNPFLIQNSKFNSQNNLEEALKKISDFHHRFTLIHPFDDGNGRTCRLLTNFILMYLNLPPIIISSNDKDRYLNALSYADKNKLSHNHLDKLLDLFSDALIDSLNLKLKAAKGLDLDEDDDLDKEISILKRNLKIQTLNSSNLNTEVNPNIDSLKEINESLALLFTEFVKTMKKFEELFTEISFSTKTDPESKFDRYLNSLYSKALSFENLENFQEPAEPLNDLDIFNLMDNFYKQGLGSMPEISCTLKKYKNSLKEDLNIASYLSVNFYQLEYEISSNYLERSMYKSYNTVLLNLEIKNICKEISRKVLAEIAGFKN